MTATNIAYANPNPQQTTYYEGHYFVYQNVDIQNNAWYHEGRIGASNGVPSGDHRYKLARDFSDNNKWCSYVDNAGAYCITVGGGGSYNNAINVTIGIESQDDQHSFLNGTSASNIWTYPTTASGFQIFNGTMSNADNNIYGWYSVWFPLQNNNNGIAFYNQ